MDTWLLCVLIVSFAARNFYDAFHAGVAPTAPTTHYGLASALLYAALTDDASAPAGWVAVRLLFAPAALVVVPHGIRVTGRARLFWGANVLGLGLAGLTTLVTVHLAPSGVTRLATGFACAGICAAAIIDVATVHYAIVFSAKKPDSSAK